MNGLATKTLCGQCRSNIIIKKKTNCYGFHFLYDETEIMRKPHCAASRYGGFNQIFDDVRIDFFISSFKNQTLSHGWPQMFHRDRPDPPKQKSRPTQKPSLVPQRRSYLSVCTIEYFRNSSK